MSSEQAKKAARESLVEWLMYALRQYRDLFDVDIHGTEKQVRALMEFDSASLATLLDAYATEARLEEAKWWHEEVKDDSDYCRTWHQRIAELQRQLSELQKGKP